MRFFAALRMTSVFGISILIMGGCQTYVPAQKGQVRSPKKLLVKPLFPEDKFLGRFYSPVEFASPLVVNHTIYQGTSYHSFIAVSEQGSIRWTFDVPGGVEATATYSGDSVYVGGNDGYLYCLAVPTGELKWKYNAEAQIFSRPLIKGNMIYFMTSDNTVYALEAETGKWLWHYKGGYQQKLSIRGTSSPTYSDGKIFIGFSDGQVVALNAFDGSVVWGKKIGEGEKFIDVDTTPHVSEKDVIVGSHDGSLYALHPNSGDTIWKRKNENVSAIASNDQMVFTSSARGKLRAINRNNGELLWEYTIEKGVPSAPEVSRSAIYIGSSANYVYALSFSGEEIWRYETGSGLTSKPVVEDNRLYIFTNYSTLHVLDPARTVVAQY